ncbi:uncharacterized protein LOC108471411 [Gossypium arboreum]|uniref:uncharacterized protein LOC108471411 n=1 Tax=Gossypium arboreum TaxID=29729 RepID=UPI00081908C7|nr:uncharacterized protein LOC108471411 [Gossypium arboreum]
MGASHTDARRREFLNLTQGDRSVAEYEAEFFKLSHYVRGMVATEYEHCVRFEDSLHLRVLIALQRERDFSALVEKAKIAEEVKHSERQNREEGKVKRDTNTAMRPKKKAMTDGPVRAKPTIAVPGGVVMCQLCNRRHPGVCWRATGGCLRCDSTEHRAKDCPLKSNQMQAPVVETAGVQQPPKGRGQVRGSNGIGQGFTHSNVACSVSETLGILCERTSSKISVVSLLGLPIRVSKLFRNVTLEVQGTVFLADLMELSFWEFNLILGMDWLVKHHVSLDCAEKRVVLRIGEDVEIVAIGEQRNYLSNVISVLVAEKELTFLGHVVSVGGIRVDPRKIEAVLN